VARRFRGGWLAVLGLVLPGGLSAAPAAPAAPAATPAGSSVWVLRGAHNSVFLAGSVHLLPASAPALPPTLERAYAEAESLVMELSPDDSDAARIGAVMLDKGRFPEHSGLAAAVGASRWERLQPWLSRNGLPPAAVEGLEPWALALLLTATEFARLGLAPDSGVEAQLRVRALREGKPVAGLETPEYQLGLFDALPPGAQLQLLDSTLDDLADADADFGRLVAAWRSGDDAELEALLAEAYAGMPQLYEALVHRRNAEWVPRVRALLEGRDDVLVVVGALHLVGERGLVALLAREGLRVERITLH
jgi:uncharacterized protein YbaP (TraB family)